MQWTFSRSTTIHNIFKKGAFESPIQQLSNDRSHSTCTCLRALSLSCLYLLHPHIQPTSTLHFKKALPTDFHKDASTKNFCITSSLNGITFGFSYTRNRYITYTVYPIICPSQELSNTHIFRPYYNVRLSIHRINVQNVTCD